MADFRVSFSCCFDSLQCGIADRVGQPTKCVCVNYEFGGRFFQLTTWSWLHSVAINSGWPGLTLIKMNFDEEEHIIKIDWMQWFIFSENCKYPMWSKQPKVNDQYTIASNCEANYIIIIIISDIVRVSIVWDFGLRHFMCTYYAAWFLATTYTHKHNHQFKLLHSLIFNVSFFVAD